ncbi:hypothetical protein TWF696_006046 [Orbilia brochopaga]|uniref:BTB domain-containing protein n=1 Tax=Orbilia brochopaga TaxID=3140254 RepID=A0AAV9UUZ3_9PEZI
MVMGHPDCPSFCTTCKQSCKCPSCHQCHWCRGCKYSQYNGYSNGCGHKNSSEHSCDPYNEERAKDEENRARIAELIDERCVLEEKNGQLQAEILQRGTERLIASGFPSLFGSETFSVAVGREHKKFTVHIDTVCAVSGYFKETLSPSVKVPSESKETVILDGGVDNVDAFEMFLQYCYLNTYLDSKYGKTNLLLLHARVYALAEKLKCSPLKSLALRKVTDWYHGYSMGTGSSTFRDIFPDILEAISIVYTYTVDTGSGFLPTTVSDVSDVKEADALRDRFRLLLAHLAAANLVNLRTESRFIDIHHSFPDFNTDMLLFMNNGPKGLMDEKETSSTVQPGGEKTEVHMQKKNILAFSGLFGADTLTVFVGEEAKRYNVHTVAIGCSDYFRGLVASDMKEIQEKTVYLNSEVDNADAFDAFVQYCYFRDYISDEDRADTLAHHARVYSLADRLSCPGLKELALQKATHLLCNASHSAELLIAVPAAVAMIYEHTYDAWGGRIPEILDPEPPTPVDEDAQGEPSTATESAVRDVYPRKYKGKKKKKFGKGNSRSGVSSSSTAHASEITIIPAERERDGFRLLLARFASIHLSELRKNKSFIATHHAFPDFAIDVVLLATSGGKMELDEEDQLKLAC